MEEYAVDDYLKDAHSLFEEELSSDVNELFKTSKGIKASYRCLAKHYHPDDM